MLKNFFYWEILMFTTTDWGWSGFIIIGLLLGVVLRNFAVRRKSEFGETLTGLAIIWLIFHVINYLALTADIFRGRTVIMSMLSSLAPVITFAVISFLLVHVVKVVKGDW